MQKRLQCANLAFMCFPTEGEVLYCGDPKKPNRLVVSQWDRVRDIRRQYHLDPMGGHSGVNATLTKITEKYWWLRMTDDIKLYVSASFDL